MDEARMRILHTLYSVGPKSFGLGPVALNLGRELNSFGAETEIWCVDSKDDCVWATKNSDFPPLLLKSFQTYGPRSVYFSPMMEKAALFKGDYFSIVHQHALWTGLSRISNKLREEKGIPTVVTPHGMLESWALKKSRWKKHIALAAYEKKNLHNASCLYACSEQEVEGFRDFGLKNPVAVAPNGISSEWLSSQGDEDRFRELFGLSSEKRIMLFLSRITPVKNLLMFMDALALVRDKLKDWQIVIAGADEFNHQAEVLERVDHLQLQEYVLFTGLLLGQTKRDAFSAANFFVLPTKREAAPVVVLEALGAGVPVLTTKGTPWQELIAHDCGWWVEVATRALADALEDAFIKTPKQLKEMGQRGQELVAEKYTWKETARMTLALYQWLLDGGDRPDFVVLD